MSQNLPDRINAIVTQQTENFALTLPDGFDAERFGRLVITAVKTTPKLADAFATPQGQTSVIIAALNCACVGLEPNTPLQHAWLLPFKNDNVVECQLIIGYRGLISLANRAGFSISARVVMDGDEFHYGHTLDGDVLEHFPRGQSAELKYAYAIARNVDREPLFVVLNRDDVEKRRAKSKSFNSEKGKKSSAWTTSEKDMWIKSAIKALMHLLPLTSDVASALTTDEKIYSSDVKNMELDQNIEKLKVSLNE
jgi:recombination protein RecT